MPTLIDNSQQKALTTLARIKVFLGIGSDKYDGVLTQLINQATGFIENYTNRRLLSQTYTNEEYDGSGTTELVLRQFPVTTFTQLQENAASDNTDDWQTIDTQNYFVDMDRGIVKLIKNSNAFDVPIGQAKFLELTQKYRVTYVAGYLIDFSQENDPSSHTLPQEIEYVCQELVSAMFNRRRQAGFNRTQTGDVSVVMRKTVFANDDLRALLDKHKKMSIAGL